MNWWFYFNEQCCKKCRFIYAAFTYLILIFCNYVAVLDAYRLPQLLLCARRIYATTTIAVCSMHICYHNYCCVLDAYMLPQLLLCSTYMCYHNYCCARRIYTTTTIAVLNAFMLPQLLLCSTHICYHNYYCARRIYTTTTIAVLDVHIVYRKYCRAQRI